MKNKNPTSNNKLNQSLGALTPNENAVIAGTLLGDAHLQKRTATTYRLKIVHSTAQADYVWWKYNKLKRLCATTKPPMSGSCK